MLQNLEVHETERNRTAEINLKEKEKNTSKQYVGQKGSFKGN